MTAWPTAQEEQGCDVETVVVVVDVLVADVKVTPVSFMLSVPVLVSLINTLAWFVEV
jgi:hypothetical protein